MIAYSTVGTNDMAKAKEFYTSLFAEAGIKPMMDMGRFVAFGNAPNRPMFSIAEPFDGNEAAPGNGNMVAIAAASPEQVSTLYEKAISLGGTCEGKPGPRQGGAFTCGYVRDLDGNKLNFFCMGT
ncbi:MAG: VOC family protein [Pseudomonadota bacterium]